MGRRSTESSLRADSWNSVPTFQGFAWGHKSEKNVVKWFEHTFLYNCHDFRQPWNEIQLPEYEYVLAVLFFITFHFFFFFFFFYVLKIILIPISLSTKQAITYTS